MTLRCDVLIVGGGTGGSAAALALAETGLSVVMAEETRWVGGQFTSQAVPPDEHCWIESFGRTRRYAALRRLVREGYGRSGRSRAGGDVSRLNPGGGWVSRLCALPADWLAALAKLGVPGPGLDVRFETVATEAAVAGDRIVGVRLLSLRDGTEEWVEPGIVLDATEVGDLLPLVGAEFALGAESQSETGEPHALPGPAEAENIQALTWCAVVSHDPGGDHTILRPREYDFWRAHLPPHWPGPLLSLTYRHALSGEARTLPLFGPEPLNWFDYRKIADPSVSATEEEPATVLNWPQNDFALGPVVGVGADVAEARLESARQLTLSLLHWLQTELGARGLRLRPDLAGTPDGLAMAPYHREGRRLVALQTLREQDVARQYHPTGRAPARPDSVGVGSYPIDVHPSANGAPGFDVETVPFQIPLGCLVPIRLRNLLAAGKGIGVTHIANGCTRLHPVEWGIGEAAGLLAAFCQVRGLDPVEVADDATLFAEYASVLDAAGVERSWPDGAFRQP